ncbi:hypothetical protein [Streptomyces sp. NPDC048516]|uniref:hypothetical protein n=1 Tax=Streptomyces sp. NPDC048516 TaxID=3365565 RepID=UPI0037206C4F
MFDATCASTRSAITPRITRPVVPIRPQADDLLLEHAVAFARLVQAALDAAPAGELGEMAASHDIADPATRTTVGGASGLPASVVRTLTRVFNDAADRLAGDDDLTAVMDAVAEPAQRPRLVAVGGA